MDMTITAFTVLAGDPNIGRLTNPGINWDYVPDSTPLGPSSGGAPPSAGTPPPTTPPPGTPGAPPPTGPPPGGCPIPAQRKRSVGPETARAISPHERKMIKRRAPVRESERMPEQRRSVDVGTPSPRDGEGTTGTIMNEKRAPDPNVRPDAVEEVPRAVEWTEDEDEEGQQRKPVNFERRMIKRRAVSSVSGDDVVVKPRESDVRP